MAEKELELESRGVRFINAGLVPLFPDRSLEAIKGKRRQADYKAILNELRAREVRLAAEDHVNVNPHPEEVANDRDQAKTGSC